MCNKFQLLVEILCCDIDYCMLPDLMSLHNLDSLAGVVSTMQPHGALIALYLLEIPVIFCFV